MTALLSASWPHPVQKPRAHQHNDPGPPAMHSMKSAHLATRSRRLRGRSPAPCSASCGTSYPERSTEGCDRRAVTAATAVGVPSGLLPPVGTSRLLPEVRGSCLTRTVHSGA